MNAIYFMFLRESQHKDFNVYRKHNQRSNEVKYKAQLPISET